MSHPQGRRDRLGDRLETVRRRQDQPYGYDRYTNVITTVGSSGAYSINAADRAANWFGPPDGKRRNVAFIQCAGSRDHNHLKHCSRICCMASLKQTTDVREKFGDDGQVSIYYIDIRAIDRLEDFYKKVRSRSQE